MLSKKHFFFRIFIFIIFFTIPEVKETKSQSITQIINKICLENFNKEINIAKLDVPTEAKDYTCKCFINYLDKGGSITQAQLYCKNKAIKKFNLKRSN